ncbi:hypothetical protein ABG768_001898, partial [Culter alburnus]
QSCACTSDKLPQGAQWSRVGVLSLLLLRCGETVFGLELHFNHIRLPYQSQPAGKVSLQCIEEPKPLPHWAL